MDERRVIGRGPFQVEIAHIHAQVHEVPGRHSCVGRLKKRRQALKSRRTVAGRAFIAAWRVREFGPGTTARMYTCELVTRHSFAAQRGSTTALKGVIVGTSSGVRLPTVSMTG